MQANTTSIIDPADLRLIAPELILTACACVALVMEVILPYRKSKLTAYFALIGVALAFKAIFLISAALAIGISTRFLDIEEEQHGEYYALILFATVGMMFIAGGYDLI